MKSSFDVGDNGSSSDGHGKVWGAGLVVKEEKNRDDILASLEENKNNYESGIQVARQRHITLWKDIAYEQVSEQDFNEKLNRAEEQVKAGDGDDILAQSLKSWSNCLSIL